MKAPHSSVRGNTGRRAQTDGGSRSVRRHQTEIPPRRECGSQTVPENICGPCLSESANSKQDGSKRAPDSPQRGKQYWKEFETTAERKKNATLMCTGLSERNRPNDSMPPLGTEVNTVLCTKKMTGRPWGKKSAQLNRLLRKSILF